MIIGNKGDLNYPHENIVTNIDIKYITQNIVDNIYSIPVVITNTKDKTNIDYVFTTMLDDIIVNTGSTNNVMKFASIDSKTQIKNKCCQ